MNTNNNRNNSSRNLYFGSRRAVTCGRERTSVTTTLPPYPDQQNLLFYQPYYRSLTPMSNKMEQYPYQSKLNFMTTNRGNKFTLSGQQGNNNINHSNNNNRNFSRNYHQNTNNNCTYNNRPHKSNNSGSKNLNCFHNNNYFVTKKNCFYPDNFNNRTEAIHSEYKNKSFGLMRNQEVFNVNSNSNSNYNLHSKSNTFINGIKNIMNSLIHPVLNCDFYSDYHRYYNPKYRNNYRRYNNNMESKDFLSSNTLSNNQSLNPLAFYFSSNNLNNCSKLHQRNKEENLSKIGNDFISNSIDNSNTASENYQMEINNNKVKALKMFSSDDFPELPPPKIPTFHIQTKQHQEQQAENSYLNFEIINKNTSCNKNSKKLRNKEKKIYKRHSSTVVPQHNSDNSFEIVTNDNVSTSLSLPKSLPSTSILSLHSSVINDDIIKCKSKRTRTLSNCSENSDDSFVICFNDNAAEGVIEFYDTKNGSENDDDDNDDSDETIKNSDDDDENSKFIVIDMEAGSQPDSGFEENKDKKVRFNLQPEVHVMRVWDYAYRAARKGDWENYALDRTRFKNRINKLENIITPILNESHRKQIYKERFCDSKQQSHKIKT